MSQEATPDGAISVLLIDDEIRQDDALVRGLASDGFLVECVHTGALGLARAAGTPPRAIALDLHLPDVLGLTVLSELRRAAVRAPVLVISGWYLDSGHAEAAAALGAAGFLRKPLDWTEFGFAIRRAVASGTCPSDSPRRVCQSLPRSSTTLGWRGAPDELVLGALHARAASGDGTALEVVIVTLLPELQRALRRTFRMADETWIFDATVDALLEYRNRPTRYDPSRGVPLSRYLLFASRRNLVNRMAAARRRSAHETPVAAPELFDRRPAASPKAEREPNLARTLAKACTEFSSAEREVLRLYLEGERRTARFARALGLEAMPLHEQRVTVKQIKDRVFVRLRRWGSAARAVRRPNA